MRGVTDAEAAMLSVLLAHPVECAMCSPLCAEQISIIVASDRSIGNGLARDGRMVLWPCAHTQWRHGRITDAGRLALRLRSLVTA